MLKLTVEKAKEIATAYGVCPTPEVIAMLQAAFISGVNAEVMKVSYKDGGK